MLVDKPPGITSTKAVAKVKRLLPRKTRIGHTGTLDPLASGLLVLMVGRVTRLSRYVADLDKTYVATARFGATSDTLDADGEILELDAPRPEEDAIRAALKDFTGELLQLPPMASAVKVGGERLYDLHRRGIEVERKSRSVKVHSFSLASIDPASQTATFEITCGSGTYVRTLISDLAHHLGTGAYLTALRRTSVGHLKAENASLPEQLSPDDIYKRIIQPKEILARLPVLEVGGEWRRVVCNGREIPASGLTGSFRVEMGGKLLAVYRGDGEWARPEVVLCAV